MELVAEPLTGRPIDPGNQVLLVRVAAMEDLSRHPEHGGKTSHDILSDIQKGYKEAGGTGLKDDEGKTNRWAGGPSQMTIMEKLGMFRRKAFVVVTFELEPVPLA